MKNFKELYHGAKTNSKEIDLYREAVHGCTTSPFIFISNSEYILPSSIGLSAFKEYKKNCGIPVSGFQILYETAKMCIKKCKQKSMDSSKYEEIVKDLENYKESHPYTFAMYENYKHFDDLEYLKIYSESLPIIKDNSKFNLNTLLSRFGEAVIPDLILANSLSNKTEKFVESFDKLSIFNSSTHYQWYHESMKEFGISAFIDKTLESVVDRHRTSMQKAYTESVITTKSDLIEVSESQLADVEELIQFKEYAVTFLPERNAVEVNNSVLDLYNEFAFAYDEMMNEVVAHSVIPMLPPGEQPKTLNKQIIVEDNLSGSIPSYLKKNADENISYGEDEKSTQKKKYQTKEFDDFDDKMENYLRPSKKEKEKYSSLDVEDSSDDEKLPAKKAEVEELKQDIKDASTAKEKQQAMNNYYYYIYTHSFNDDKSIKINSNSPSANIGDSKPVKEAVKEETDDDIEKDKPTTTMQDMAMDLDRALTSTQQKAKKAVQGFLNVGSTFLKPFRRTAQWISSMVSKWKAADENNIKEKMADPQSRKGLFNAVKSAIIGGALFKAGILLNPIFLFLAVTRRTTKHGRESRIRNELIGELRTEIEIIDEKIRDASHNGDSKAKYRLMRIKNEINKKLIRVGINLNANNQHMNIL